jgi:hypothetical protein
MSGIKPVHSRCRPHKAPFPMVGMIDNYNCRLEALKFEILQVLIHYFKRNTSGIVSINHPNGVQGETISAMVYSIIKNQPTTNG